MIKSLKVKNSRGKSALFELAKPKKTGILITEITGIGPVKAEVRTADYAGRDGAVFNSARTPKRSIVIVMQILSTDAESKRHELYELFPNKETVALEIETKNRKLRTQGIVEDNEPDIFKQTVTSGVSIVCPDPNFYAIEEQVTTFTGTLQLFEFPFSNESLTQPLIEFGEIITNSEKNIFYAGDDSIGITVRIRIVGQVRGDIEIHDVITREKMIVSTEKISEITGEQLQFGDEIIIETTTGNKGAKLMHDGRLINVVNALGKWIDWLELKRGDNLFLFVAEDIENVEIQIENRTSYKGV